MFGALRPVLRRSVVSPIAVGCQTQQPWMMAVAKFSTTFSTKSPEEAETTTKTVSSESGPSEGQEACQVAQPPVWTIGTRRVGAVGIKKGMTTLWDENGMMVPSTVIELKDLQVVGHDKEKMTVMVGCANRRPHTTTKQMLGIFKKAGILPKHKVAEFPVDSEAAFPPIGSSISAAHFVPGQKVDVQSKTIGKGFQGPMKRWDFAGQPASHGNSKTHRAHGSIGANTTPGRVLPGKKMAGRMGGKTATQSGLRVMRVDTALNVIYVNGCVPGHTDSFVKIRDCLKKPVGTRYLKNADVEKLPFPAATKEADAQLPRELLTAFKGRDPWTRGE